MKLEKLKDLLIGCILFLSIGSISYILASEDIFKKFTPRSLCMFNDDKLIAIHGLSDFLIFIAYVGIAYGLYTIYKSFQHKDIPFKGFFWMYAGFIFLCGLTHLIGVINLWVTFYWVDGILKLLTAWFSIATAISFIRAHKLIKEMKSPGEYQRLADELRDLRQELMKERSK